VDPYSDSDILVLILFCTFLVSQIMDMGICRNGAVKALYWTGNNSALAASNWIFDQPDRDLDTPLEDELEMIRAQQAEREREEHEERKLLSQCQQQVGLEKTRVKKKNSPVGYFGIFAFFFGFFGFLRFFLYCPEERVFRVFSISRILLDASRL
jgi:hypothetical protein